jgi:predicted Fe-Mo cluster-binding NifX family protein
MKIAISSQGMQPTAQVDPQFGRTKWFVLHNTETGEWEPLENEQVLNLEQGAGIQAARHIIDRKVEVVLTGHCGPNAFRTLTEAGVQVVLGAAGTVQEAVAQFRTGGLRPAAAPDVEGHS